MDAVFAWLSADIPQPQASSIIHNDLKLDNCQFQPDDPDTVTAIFDWDMCTLGDPLIDFGTTLAYWPDPRIKLSLSLAGDFPPKSFLIDQYQQQTGFSMDRIAWYEAFSYWRIAIVLQQLYKRYVDGATKDKRMAYMGENMKNLADVARQTIEG